MYLIVRCNATSFPYGTQKVATDLSVDYEDFTGQHKSDKDSVGELTQDTYSRVRAWGR